MNETPMTPEVTSDDKLWAALGYPIVIVALIVLFMEEKKARSFIKFHAVQAIALKCPSALRAPTGQDVTHIMQCTHGS